MVHTLPAGIHGRRSWRWFTPVVPYGTRHPYHGCPKRINDLPNCRQKLIEVEQAIHGLPLGERLDISIDMTTDYLFEPPVQPNSDTKLAITKGMTTATTTV